MRTRLTIKINGLNLDNLLNILYSKKFNISNVCPQKGDKHTLVLTIEKKDFDRAMTDRVFDNFEVCVVRERSLNSLLRRIVSLFGAFIGFLTALFVGLENGSKIWSINIDISGTFDPALKQSIVQTLKDNDACIGAKLGNISMFDLSQAIIASNTEISTATVERNGTTLNVKVYMASSVFQTGDLLATRNGVIKDIFIGTGTPAVAVGDVVSEGDVLLKADSSGNAVGTILATVYYMGTSVYNENVEIVRETGRTHKYTTLELFGLKIGGNNSVPFEYYKKNVASSFCFNNFFLPIVVTKFEFCELEKTSKYIPFEEVEENLKEEAKALAYQNLNSACQIVNIDYTIRREGNIVKVDCFIESLENIAG